MASTKLEVEKFTGENDFHLWRLKMRALLVHQRLDVALDDESTSKKPMKVTEEELSEVLDRAHSAIILSLGDGVLREVGGEKTVAGLWKKLKDLYTKKSMAKRLATKKKLYTLQMEEGSSITYHIDAFNKIILDLEDINVKIDDEDKAMILLCSLPSSYENLVDTLMYGRQTLAIGDVKEALSSKAAIKKETRDGEGLTARGRAESRETSKNKKKRSKSRPKNLKCFHCHKEGHFKKDCPEFKNKKKRSKSRPKNLKCFHCHKEGHFKKDCPEFKNKKNKAKEKSGDAAVASEFEESDGYDSAGVLIATNAQTKGNWVLDSGCSFHMCPNKTLFTNYETCDGGVVVMGNDSSCRVVGRGSIRLEMFDGMIRELRDVRHVPDLKRNLISLGMLDKIGCLVKLEPGTLKVLKGSMVVMKRNMSNGLYVLQESAITGDVAVSNQKTNKTMLWHMRLGHMSERGLVELSKQGVLGVDKIEPLRFCEDCVLGKSSRVKFSTGIHNSKGTLDYIHADLWGPTQTASLGGARTPYELWSGKPADYSQLRIFGCPAYAHVKQGKLEPRAFKCVFLGYSAGVKGYKLWCTDMKPPRAIISRDVVFNEHEMLQNSATENQPIERKSGGDKKSFLEVEFPSSSTEADKKTRPENARGIDLPEREDESEGEDDLRDYQLVRDRKKREIKPPKRYAYADLIAFALSATQGIEEDELKSYTEAVSSKDSKKWIAAMNEEMRSLIKNHTWDLIPKLAKKKVVGCKWIYKIKEGIPGVEPLRYKVRLVAKGFTQKEGIDFNEVFSPVVRHSSLRILLALVAVNDMHLEQMDVKTAFLHSEFEEMIVMAQPRGYEDPAKADYCPRTEDEKAKMSTTPYSSAVGYLMYAMVLTRPDISHAVSVVSSGTADYGLIYGTKRGTEVDVEGYVDADYADDLDKRRSLTCYLFTLSGCTINWKASLQSVVALSTTEAEYTVLSVRKSAEAFKEAIWLRGMVTELGFEQRQVVVHCDSQSAICLSKNQVHHEKTKHIDIKLHFFRLEVSKGVVKLIKVHTDNNLADMLTKVVPVAKLEFCMNSAGICRL
ncbi:hypothetical protein KPL70_017043 [Citrus sinensis]|nr:hypothetical protein KPL70_017043 [Citrus sinensis]